MIKNDEQLIRQFMQANKQEVADNGFSRKVIRRLPLRPKDISDTLTAIGLILSCILFYVFDGLTLMLDSLQSTFHHPAIQQITNLNLQVLLPVLGIIVVWGLQKAIAMSE